MIDLLQTAYCAPRLLGLNPLSLIKAAQRSSMREYCLSTRASSLLERLPSCGEVQYILTRASMQIIAEHRLNVIMKAGDFSAFLKERMVDFFTMLKVFASMVILYTLPSDLKAYVEDLLENTTGLDLSSLLPRMRRTLFTWYSATPSWSIILSRSGSVFSSSSKTVIPSQRLTAPYIVYS